MNSIVIPSKRDSSLKKTRLQLDTTQESLTFDHEGYEHSTVQIKFKEIGRRVVNVGRKRTTNDQADNEEEGAPGNRPISPTSPRYSPAD